MNQIFMGDCISYCPGCAKRWHYEAFGQPDEEGDPHKLEGMCQEWMSHISFYEKTTHGINYGYHSF